MWGARCAFWVPMLFGACAGPSAGDGAVSGERDDPRPNIILILADDIGVECFGSYGGESYATPRLDALAAGGMRFTQVYSQTLCTPSRVKLMTGRSNLRNYVRFSTLDPRERTFGHLAQEAGYATAVVGKWQLLGAEHYGEHAGTGTHPRDAGFDRWCLWQVERVGSRYASPTMEIDGELHRDMEGAYGPDVSVDYLLDFAAAHRDRPFLVYYPMALVHDPFEPTPASAEQDGDKQACFSDMVAYMDHLVGRIEDGIAELGLREDTIILFTTDNGTGRAIRSLRDGVEVRGGKARSTNAGTHVPLIASWPGVVAENATCEDLIGFDDFFPTLAALMGTQLPNDRVIDGRSILPQLRGEPGDPREVLTIYSNPRPPGSERNPRVCFARDKRYKLYDDGRFFDCVADPREETALDRGTLSPQLQQITADLQAALDALPPEPAHLRAD